MSIKTLNETKVEWNVVNYWYIFLDLDSSEIPVLWSAPESILEDHYDSKTDIWMLGLFIYEVFTHGCHPYTEVYRTPTEHLLEYVSSFYLNKR
jgi:serine/threonine protein kinase